MSILRWQDACRPPDARARGKIDAMTRLAVAQVHPDVERAPRPRRGERQYRRCHSASMPLDPLVEVERRTLKRGRSRYSTPAACPTRLPNSCAMLRKMSFVT